MKVLGICVEWLITFIEIAMCHYFMRIFFTDQFQKKKQRLIYFAVVSVTATGVVLLNLVDISFSVATVLYTVIITAIGSCVLYKGHFADFLVVSLSFVTSLNVLEWAYLNILSFLWSPEVILKMEAGFSLLRILIITLAKGIEIVVCLLISPFLKKMVIKLEKAKSSLMSANSKPNGQAGGEFWRLPGGAASSLLAVWALPVAGMAFLLSFYLFHILGTGFELNLNPAQLVLMIGIVFLLCFVYLCYRLKRIQNEQIFIARQNRLLQKNYEMARNAYQANAELYHDMRNHFLLLQNYLSDGKIEEAQRYLEKLSGSKAIQNADRWTGIEAIDYILAQKAGEAGRRQIDVTINAEYLGDCTIEPVDLCTIITNLLDNAMEGAEKCPARTDKKIDITIRRIHQFILINIKNSAAVPPVQRSGRIITTKKNKMRHGWGMRSILSAVEKYNGTVEYQYADSIFSTSVILFYP
jgi:sensor histidine kinase YesM